MSSTNSTTSRDVTHLATSDAALLLFTFGTGVPRPMPRGAEPSDVAAAFTGWEIVDVRELSPDALPPPLRRRQVPGRWLRLHRR